MVSFDFFIFYLFAPLFIVLTISYINKLIVLPLEETRLNWQVSKYTTNNIFLLSYPELSYYTSIHFIMLITMRGTTTSWGDLNNFFFFSIFFFVLTVLIYILFLIKKQVNTTTNNLIISISLWFYLLFITFPYINNLIIFFLALETISVLYYFFFLHQTSSNLTTFIKLKNLLANYLWLSFLTLITFVGCITICFSNVGTANFSQLTAAQNFISQISWYFLLASIMWKIGSPGFHFFKLELYQYLPLHTLIFFSLISVYFNTYLLLFFFYNFLLYFVYHKYSTLIIILIINIFLLIRGLKLNSFYQFLGFSAINTWTTILLMLLI